AGGFDTRVPRAAAEDRELCDRWRQQGRPMIYAPGAVVDHAHAMNFRKYWRQHFDYGRGAHYFHGTRARRDARPVRLEHPTFYLNLALYPFRRAPGRRALPLAGLMATSQVAHALGFVWAKMRP